VLDNEQIGKVKHCLRQPIVDSERLDAMLSTVRKVMASSNRLYARHARKPIKAGEISSPYLFESKDHQDRVIEKALDRLAEIDAAPAPNLDKQTVDRIYEEVPGLLAKLRVSA
jgi:chorismate mutase